MNRIRAKFVGPEMPGATLLGGLGTCETPQLGVNNTAERHDSLIEASPSRVAKAATTVLGEDYMFTIDSNASTAIDAKIVAHTAQGIRVGFWVERAGKDSSRASVRVGELFGDQKLSLEILDKVRERSKTLTEKIRENL